MSYTEFVYYILYTEYSLEAGEKSSLFPHHTRNLWMKYKRKA